MSLGLAYYTCGGQMSRGRAHTLLRRPTPGPGIPLLSLRAPCSLKIAPKQPISIYLLGPLVPKYEIDNGVPWDLAQNPIGERGNLVYGMRAPGYGGKGEDGKAKTQW